MLRRSVRGVGYILCTTYKTKTVGERPGVSGPVSAFAQGDQAIYEAAQILCLGQRGLDLLVLEQGDRHVAEHGLAVGAAHLGGGGDWAPTLRVARETPNLWIDISGSGCDLDMMHRAVELVGVERMVFGTDLTMCTGWGKLRYLEQMGLSPSDLARVRAGNAQEIFPDGSFA